MMSPLRLLGASGTEACLFVHGVTSSLFVIFFNETDEMASKVAHATVRYEPAKSTWMCLSNDLLHFDLKRMVSIGLDLNFRLL